VTAIKRLVCNEAETPPPGRTVGVRRADPAAARWIQVDEALVDGERIGLHGWSEGADSGSSIVLVHGLEESWETWTALARRLGGRHRLYALDLPWRAQSSHRWMYRNSSVDLLRSSLALVPQLPHIAVGHSFGANTLLEVLVGGLPRPPRAAALLAPLCRPRSRRIDWAFFDESVDRFRTVMRDGVKAHLSGRVAEPPEPVVEAMLAGILGRVEPGAFLALFALLSRAPELSLSQLGLPALVVNGLHDLSSTPETIRELAGAMPEAHLVQSAEFSHFCHIEQAGAIAALLSEFASDAFIPVLGDVALAWS
jgi:pimeloyl-ACP methyl ester carboxylesterase